MSCWFPFDKYTCQLLPNWLFHSLTPHTSAPFTQYYCIHSSFHKQLPDKVGKAEYGGINALMGSSWHGLVTRCWGGAECPVSVIASLIKLGTIAHHMCAMFPNNTKPICIVLGARWMGLPVQFVVMEKVKWKSLDLTGRLAKFTAAGPWCVFLVCLIFL